MNNTTNQVIIEIQSILKTLGSYPNLHPTPEINELFNRLVNIIYKHASSDQDTNDILCSLLEQLPEIHKLCSDGEFAMECYWSEQISSKIKSLDQFPYYQHYQKLVKAEQQLLQKFQRYDQKRMLFVGSGPLPLSALLFAQNFQWLATCLDKEHQAYQLGKALIAGQVDNSNITYIQKDIYQYQNLHNYDVIILGALVGNNHEQKQEILNHLALHTHPRTQLLVRSAKGLRTLLYPELKLAQINSWKVLAVDHPSDEVINSMVILAKH